MTTAEFSLASFLPGVLKRGAAPCCSLPTRFSHSCDANSGCALHLYCTAEKWSLLCAEKVNRYVLVRVMASCMTVA